MENIWNGSSRKIQKGNLIAALGLAAALAVVIGKKGKKQTAPDKKKRADADGLSRSDHEIYPSGTGWFNCKKGISEDRSGLWKKKMEKSGRLMKKSGQHVMKWTVEFLRQRHIEDLESDVDR